MEDGTHKREHEGLDYGNRGRKSVGYHRGQMSRAFQEIAFVASNVTDIINKMRIENNPLDLTISNSLVYLTLNSIRRVY